MDKCSFTFTLFLVLCLVSISSGFATAASSLPVATRIPSNSITTSFGSSPAENNESDSSLSKSEEPLKDTKNIASLIDGTLRNKSTDLLDEIGEMRKAGSQDKIESLLNEILALVDVQEEGESSKTAKRYPWWTKFRFTSRFSRRSRRASLQRVLDLSTPSAEETESLGDDVDAKRRRRRRSLVVVLRTLAQTDNDDDSEGDSTPKKNKRSSIYQIEKTAKKAMKLTSKDIVNRVPPGLETPKYTVIAKGSTEGGEFEVREYDAFSVCSVPMSKPRPADNSSTDQKLQNPQLSGASSFGALAGYLFGKNQEDTPMKMTTPVFTTGQEDEKEMAFVLPSKYWDGASEAPAPLENSLVTVKREEGGLRATVMFGGFASEKDVKARKAELLKGLEADKEWTVVEDAPLIVAQYNDPFTPPWKRRNEVSVAVKKCV